MEIALIPLPPSPLEIWFILTADGFADSAL